MYSFEKKMAPLACALLAGRWTSALAQTSVAVEPAAASSVEQQIVEFERRLCDAAVRKDRDALAGMLANDLIYTQKDGTRQGKKEYLASLATGKGAYTAYSIKHSIVNVVGAAAAVVHGRYAYGLGSKGSAPSGEAIYTAVYVLSSGQWQLADWEDTTVRK